MTGPIADEPERFVGTRSELALTIGLVLTVTIFAIDTLALVAVMPVIEADLGGRAWYGAVFSVFVIVNVVAIVATAGQVGRRTLRGLLDAGLVVFVIGLVLAAVAPTMPLLVVARAVQGGGAGMFATVVYAAVAAGFDDRRRPRVLAAMSTAWVVPSLVAPTGSAWIADHFHWRWVFVLLIALTIPAAVLTSPRLRGVGPSEPEQRRPGELRAAFSLAAALVVLQSGLAADREWMVVLAAIVGVAWLVPSLARLLPSGSLTGRGVIGGALLSKLLAGLVFLGTDAFIPLALTDVHGHSPTAAGLTLTVGALTWTAGSWTVANKNEVWSERTMNRSGHLLMAGAVGAVLPVATDVDHAFVIAMAAWAVAGFGVGLVFGTVNVVALREAPAGQVGSVSASLQLADVIGFAIATGAGGVIIAVGERNGWHPGSALVLWWSTLAAIALAAAAVAARDLPDRRPAVAAR